MPDAIDIDAPLKLLGNLSPVRFMRKHWHKRPLLVRGALADVAHLPGRTELFRLAGRDDVESRLVLRSGTSARSRWEVQPGPLARRKLPPVTQPGWTLLVQGVDLHVPAAHELLARFRFAPQARLDDLMISWASDGGGVGPHFDSYDVFLVQVQGRRRWRIAPLSAPDAAPGHGTPPTLRRGQPLKLLARFEPTEEHVLECGDMLYLPPRWAHDGEAVGECMTCSVGFRAPSEAELVRELLARVADDAGAEPTLYSDPGQGATCTAGAMPAGLQRFARRALRQALRDPVLLDRVLGEYLSEPKAQVWFAPLEGAWRGTGVRLDPRTRMLYDAHHVFINGEAWRMAGADARVLRRLADDGHLPAQALDTAGPTLRQTLGQWVSLGWLQETDDDRR